MAKLPSRESGLAEPPLHQQSPTTRFSDRVADYVKHRPSYPVPAIDAVLEGLGPPQRVRAADIGAGTGISSRLLAERGVRVTAVEPNADMRAGAEAHPLVHWVGGAAEATGLGAASLDLVLCAQAFHWFNAGPALAEFRRILRPGGRLALMWNARDRSDPFTLGYCNAIVEVGGESKAETMEFDPACIGASGLFEPARLSEFANAQVLDLAGLLGRAASASYVPKSGPAHARLNELLTGLHRRFADALGQVHLAYVTRVYISSAKP